MSSVHCEMGMSAGYAEARNMVFPKIDMPDRSYRYEILTHISRFLLGLIFLVFA